MKNLHISSIFLSVLAILCLAAPSYALTITVDQYPTVSTTDSTYDALVTETNNQVRTAMDQAVAEFNDKTKNWTKFDNIAKGFANAGLYSHNSSASLNSFQNYDLFAVMGGLNVGLNLPENLTNIDYYKNIASELQDNPNITLGASGCIAGNVGFRLGVLPLIPDRLYVNAKFSGFNTDLSTNAILKNFTSSGSLSLEGYLKSFTFGVGVNYAIIKEKSFLGGLARWRGISVGSGFNYVYNATKIKLNLEDINQNFSASANVGVTPTTFSGDVKLQPSVELLFNSKAGQIPLEVSTAVQFLYIFNLSLGAGCDLNMGHTEIEIGGSAITSLENINISGVPNKITTGDSGKVTAKETAGNKPSVGDFRLMAGLGFNFGPVKLDVPVTYYLTKGLALGVSLGVVW